MKANYQINDISSFNNDICRTFQHQSGIWSPGWERTNAGQHIQAWRCSHTDTDVAETEYSWPSHNCRHLWESEVSSQWIISQGRQIDNLQGSFDMSFVSLQIKLILRLQILDIYFRMWTILNWTRISVFQNLYMQKWTLPHRIDPSQPDIKAVAENAQSPLLADQDLSQFLHCSRGGAGNSSKFE